MSNNISNLIHNEIKNISEELKRNERLDRQIIETNILCINKIDKIISKIDGLVSDREKTLE